MLTPQVLRASLAKKDLTRILKITTRQKCMNRKTTPKVSQEDMVPHLKDLTLLTLRDIKLSELVDKVTQPLEPEKIIPQNARKEL